MRWVGRPGPVWAWMGCVAIVWGASSAATAQPATVKVGGTGVGSVVLAHVLEDFQRSHPQHAIQLVMPPMGSAGSLRALAAGSIQLAVVSFPPGQQVPGVATWSSSVLPWITTPLVFTGRDLPPGTDLTTAQVAELYAGRTGRWPDGKRVRLITRTELETDTRLLRAWSTELDQAVQIALKRLGQPVAENDVDNQALLERTPGSFGAIALGQLMLTRSPLRPARFNGVAPTPANLQAGDYGLGKGLYLVVPKESGAAVRDLVKHLQSGQVLAPLRAQGFVPLQP